MTKIVKIIINNKGKVIIGLLVILVGYLVISKLTSDKTPKGIRLDTYNAKRVETDTYLVKPITLKETLTLTGKIQAEKQAVVQFQTGGKLVWVGVKEGDSIRKGQAIASLDKQELKKQFEKQANNYLTSRWNFEDVQDKYKVTKEKALITDEIQRILDRQQFTLNNSVLDYELADLAVKYATIYAPFEGIITYANPKYPNVNIISTSTGYTVVDPQSVYFRSEIDEEDVNKIALDQKAALTIDSYSNETINSNVQYISFIPVEGQTSTVYEVRFSITGDNKTFKYRLGMNGEAVIDTLTKENVLAVPTDSVWTEKQQYYVYLKGNGSQYHKTKVEVGILTDELTEITAGINENDMVLVDLPKI